jgi:predicted ATPase
MQWMEDISMPELSPAFQSMPEEYQDLVRLVQERYDISIAPLQLLVGGWSGAIVYLVSVSSNETGRVQHCILKLDRKGKSAKSDEVARHNAVMEKSTPEFARAHIAQLVYDRVDFEDAIAILYRIAGQSLLKYRPLSYYERQNQLGTIFAQTNQLLLEEWNANLTFEQAVPPQQILQKWLGFRLNHGGNIERFLQESGVDPEIAGFLINGHVFPNPLFYARHPEPWHNVRSIDIATGFIHGDLNTNNILVKFSEDNQTLEGYYLIDFALFKDQLPLLYDQRYLEMSYLMHATSQISFAKCVNFLSLFAHADVLDPRHVSIETAGIGAVIAGAGTAFATWVQESHPSLHDDLWGQYWLAGVAAGLSYCHKPGLSDEQRLTGLIYATANLKRYIMAFNLPLPTNVELLYDENQFDTNSSGTLQTKKQERHNLPSQPTLFIGRQSELTAVRELVMRESQDVRLVTMTGPGGTGKTRLALRAASELADLFTDGVYFVDLAPIREPEGVPAAIARTIGLRETSDRPPIDELKAQLQTRTMLLLLDNFEQVTSAAPAIAQLLQHCARVKILVTSREALHLRGEHIYPVPPLGIPSADLQQQSIEQLTQSEAVQLFIDRVLAVKPDFALTDVNARVVAEICLRLDGLPLAIELAAARIRLFSPQALLERLGSRMNLLRGGARDLPARQQTLRDTIDWSYQLLDTDEQRLLRVLSIFSGCTLEAAEAVAAAINHPDGMTMDTLDRLASLVDKSLIRQVEQDAGEPRLVMLETIREYAAERLDQDVNFSAIAHRAFATYFAEFTRQQWEHLTGQGRETALREMEPEIDNVRTAWRFWVKEKDLEQLTKFVNSLWLVYDARGWYHDTVSLTNDLLDLLATTPSTTERLQQEIMLQTGLARALLATKGYTEEVEQAYARALELCEGAGEIPQLFPVLRGLASFYVLRMENEKSMQMGERILALAEHLDDADMKIEGQMILGYNLGFKDAQAGVAYLENAVASYDLQRPRVARLGLGSYPTVVGLTVSALFLWGLGYPDRARKRAADSILLARKMNHPYSITYALFHNGLLNVWLKNYKSAQESAQTLLELAEVHGFQIWRAVGSCLLGTTLVELGSAEKGLSLIEQGLDAYQDLKSPPVFWPTLLHLCAGAHGAASKPETGLHMLNEAMEVVGSSKSADTFASEFLSLKAALLLALSSDHASEAEALYEQAVLNAQEVHAPMLELRAAIGLSRLWHEQDDVVRARKVLSEAYSKITEGFTTPDLKEASALLTELSK